MGTERVSRHIYQRPKLRSRDRQGRSWNDDRGCQGAMEDKIMKEA